MNLLAAILLILFVAFIIAMRVWHARNLKYEAWRKQVLDEWHWRYGFEGFYATELSDAHLREAYRHGLSPFQAIDSEFELAEDP